MPTVAYIGKHSKDRVLSVYLPKRVYVDEGEGVEPIQAIVRLHPKRIGAVGPNQGARAGWPACSATPDDRANPPTRCVNARPCRPVLHLGHSRVRLADVRVRLRALRL